MDMYSARRGTILEDHMLDDVTIHTDEEGTSRLMQGNDVLVLSEGQMLSLAEYYHKVFGLSSVHMLFDAVEQSYETEEPEPLMPLYGYQSN